MTAQRPTLADLWCDKRGREHLTLAGIAATVFAGTLVLYPRADDKFFVALALVVGYAVVVLATRYQALTDDADNTVVTVDVTVETPALPAPETDTYTPATPDAERWW